MSQLKNELLQCRSLLELALARIDAVVAALPQDQKQIYDAEDGLSYLQNTRYNAAADASQPRNAHYDIPAASIQRQNERYDSPSSAAQPQDQRYDEAAGVSQPPNRRYDIRDAMPQSGDGGGGDATTAAGPAPLPSPEALVVALRVGALRGMPRRSIRAASKILLRLQSAPGMRHSYGSLSTLTGLTERSLVVHMGALQRRGLLLKTGFQTYALTEAGVAAMREAAAGQ